MSPGMSVVFYARKSCKNWGKLDGLSCWLALKMLESKHCWYGLCKTDSSCPQESKKSLNVTNSTRILQSRSNSWTDLARLHISAALSGQRLVFEPRQFLKPSRLRLADQNASQWNVLQIKETATLQNTRTLSMGLQLLLPRSRSHQISIKAEYKHHEISKYLSLFKNCGNAVAFV